MWSRRITHLQCLNPSSIHYANIIAAIPIDVYCANGTHPRVYSIAGTLFPCALSFEPQCKRQPLTTNAVDKISYTSALRRGYE